MTKELFKKIEGMEKEICDALLEADEQAWEYDEYTLVYLTQDINGDIRINGLDSSSGRPEPIAEPNEVVLGVVGEYEYDPDCRLLDVMCPKDALRFLESNMKEWDKKEYHRVLYSAVKNSKDDSPMTDEDKVRLIRWKMDEYYDSVISWAWGLMEEERKVNAKEKFDEFLDLCDVEDG